MSTTFRYQKNITVLQESKNELSIKRLDDLEQEKSIRLDGTIQEFVMSVKDDMLCVILDSTPQINLFGLTSGTRFETDTRFEYFSFELIFIHLGSLWLGSLVNSTLSFNIQQFNDCSQSTCSASVEDLSEATISAYYVNRDLLICAFQASDHTSTVALFQLLDSKEIKPKAKFALEAGQVTQLQSNENNSLVALTTNEPSQVVVIENAQWLVPCPMPGKSPVISVKFGASLWHSFLVTTSSTVYVFHYQSSTRQCVLCDQITLEPSTTVVAYKLPSLYQLTAQKGLVARKYRELETFQSHHQTLVELLGLPWDDFVHSLYSGRCQEKAVWTAVAKRCVHQRHFDSALFAVTKSDAPGVVRCARHEMATAGPLPALAVLAVHLDLLEEAEGILQEVDGTKLSKLFRLQDKWTEAFNSADKIELRSLYYDYAKQLEGDNKIQDAIKYYELSGNIAEIPRMLFESGNIAELKDYCLEKHEGKTNNFLITWWGQYCESQADNAIAIEMYRLAGDYYNLVRLLCHLGQLEQASHLVDHYLEQKQTGAVHDEGEESGITAAILFLGKHLESVNSADSIGYYLQCGAIRHALRVCVAHELWDELVQVAVEHCEPDEARRILATHFRSEQSQRQVSEENLAQLYYKCGDTKKAIRFLIHHRLWDQLRNICHRELAQEQRSLVIQRSEIDLILQCLREDSSIIDVVIDLMLMSHEENFDGIIEVINQFGIHLDEDLMNKLEIFTASQQNPALVSTFAELCLEKGNYQLAAKLFNKIGRRVEAVKALIRAGQPDKVIQFASVARDRTVFKMVANYLQTIEHADTALIMRFYTKAEAREELERYKAMLAQSDGTDDA